MVLQKKDILTKYFYAFKLLKEGLSPFPQENLMPKAIPEGGKRVIQVKVNFNEPEKECLDKLVEFYKSDRSSTLRKLLINWNNLEKYVVSIEEVKSKVSDICKRNKDKLSNDI